MTTIELAKKELEFSSKEIDSLYEEYEFLKKDPINIYPDEEKGYGTMMTAMFCQIWIAKVKDLEMYFSESYKRIKNQIDILLSKEEIKNFAIERTMVLQDQLESNKWGHHININNLGIVTNELFLGDIHKKMFDLFDEKFSAFQKERYPQSKSQRLLVEKYQQILHENFFDEFYKLLKIIVDVKMIQILRRKLGKTDTESVQLNFYPLVFKNQSEDFFMYCMKHQDQVTKTLVSKYFEIFKEDGYILQTVKHKNFFNFINEKYDLGMERIEPLGKQNESEREEYESLKSYFFKS